MRKSYHKFYRAPDQTKTFESIYMKVIYFIVIYEYYALFHNSIRSCTFSLSLCLRDIRCFTSMTIGIPIDFCVPDRAAVWVEFATRTVYFLTEQTGAWLK